MKISPVATPVQSLNPNEGMSANPDKKAKAVAAAAGEPVEAANQKNHTDPQVDRAQNSIKKIKMRTQRSPDRHMRLEEAPVTTQFIPKETQTPEETAPTQSDKMATNEQAPAVSEDTKPLSPQYAALAKEKRALQLERQKLEAEKQALSAQTKDTTSLEEYRARIKANALKVLQEEGVTYDQLTEQILASNQENADLTALRNEIKALKEGLENQNKSLTERDAQTEQQALNQINRDVVQLVSQGDDYEMIREAGYTTKVTELIHRTFKQTGELLDTQEAADLIENELLEESLKFAKIKKVQSRLNPSPTQQIQPVQKDRPNTKIMRTLTNRDGASSVSMSKRERAIAAMEGRLK